MTVVVSALKKILLGAALVGVPTGIGVLVAVGFGLPIGDCIAGAWLVSVSLLALFAIGLIIQLAIEDFC